MQDHLPRLQTVYDERFAHEYGPWRPVMGEVASKFLACGILQHGFARIRCDDCAHEYLLAFSCKCRYFCPSCHAQRLALWTQWLDATLLASVPHRQVVRTLPKRRRAYCLYRRHLRGPIARVAAGTVTAAVRTLTGERDLAVGIVACLQTHGSRANGPPHLHLLVTDGGFRPDGTFVSWPVHDTARLTEAFRCAVLRLFVRRELFDEDQAAGMLPWPHSGFHVHTAGWVPEDDRAFATRLARSCARNPVALERLTYDRATKTVTYRSDKAAGPTAGTETADALAFLARVRVPIPEKGPVTTPRLAPTEASRRWAALLRQLFEVDPLACPRCHGPMRIVAFLTQRSVIVEGAPDKYRRLILSRVLRFDRALGAAQWSEPVDMTKDDAPAVRVFPSVAVARNTFGTLYYEAITDQSHTNVDVLLQLTDSRGQRARVKLNDASTDWRTVKGDNQYSPGQHNFGDYISLASDGSRFVAAWTDGREGRSRIHVRVIDMPPPARTER